MCARRWTHRAKARAGAAGRVRQVAMVAMAAMVAMRARVLIRPKAGILDPQGAAVERALPALGFGGVTGVHVGRMIELDVDDDDGDDTQLESMCERLLANPLVEDYEIELLADRAQAAQ